MGFHKQRGEQRTTVAVMVRMRAGDREYDVMLANASSRGVLALAERPPKRGTKVELAIGDSCLTGRVRWATADRCGIALNEAIRVPDLIEGNAVMVRLVPQNGIRHVPARAFAAIAGDGSPARRVLNLFVLSALVAGASYAAGRMGIGGGDQQSSDLAMSEEHPG